MIWKSTDASIASVNSNGIVKANGIGSATITATTDNGLTAECQVTVIRLPQYIYLDWNELKLTIGESVKIYASVWPNDATDKSIRWSSSDESVATVDHDGLIHAESVGNVLITAATSNGITAECYVYVEPIYVESILLDHMNIIGEIGNKIQVKALVLPETATYKDLLWESNNTNVATVTSDGLIEIIGEGSCKITATATDDSGVFAHMTVNGLSDVQDIFEENEYYDVYTITGILVKTKCSKDDLKHIIPDIYIFKYGSSSKIIRLN